MRRLSRIHGLAKVGRAGDAAGSSSARHLSRCRRHHSTSAAAVGGLASSAGARTASRAALQRGTKSFGSASLLNWQSGRVDCRRCLLRFINSRAALSESLAGNACFGAALSRTRAPFRACNRPRPRQCHDRPAMRLPVRRVPSAEPAKAAPNLERDWVPLRSGGGNVLDAVVCSLE